MRKFSIILMILLLFVTGCSSSGTGNSTTTDNTSEETSSTAGDTAANDPDHTLVAYFSQTGHTKAVAEVIASDLNAQMYQIEPAVPYTDEDINYESEGSRSETEQKDSSSRPEIKETIPDMDKYTVIYLGYPIWYGEAPRIIDTFLESYDFAGKTIVPFCTSGSTGIEESEEILEALAPGADWVDGKRFSEEQDSETITDWVKSLDIN